MEEKYMKILKSASNKIICADSKVTMFREYRHFRIWLKVEKVYINNMSELMYRHLVVQLKSFRAIAKRNFGVK